MAYADPEVGRTATTLQDAGQFGARGLGPFMILTTISQMPCERPHSPQLCSR